MVWGIVEGVGICDRGKWAITENGRLTKWRRVWGGMLWRCYNEKAKQTSAKSYANCSVDSAFLNFQGFMNWAESQYGFYEENWEIDKDLLVKNNKVYGPNRCVLLPHEINKALIRRKSCRGNLPIGVHWRADRNYYVAQTNQFGKTKRCGHFHSVTDAFEAYSEAKKEYMNELANKWRDKIDPRAYEALINFTPEIND